MTWGDEDKLTIFCCSMEHGHDVCKFKRQENDWVLDKLIAQNTTALLQLDLSYEENHLIGTHMNGFLVSGSFYISFTM